MTKLKDLTGEKFGYWTVIKPAEDYISTSGQHQKQWLCRCICGKEKIVIQSSLKSGRSSSCGCMASKKYSQKIDEGMIGRKFGRLTVISRAEDYVSPKGAHSPKWHCLCDCGNKIDIMGMSLKNGDTTSCGCKQPNHQQEYKVKDYTGQQFGDLTVLFKITGTHPTKYKCSCACGNQVEIYQKNLTNGSKTHCGCKTVRKKYQRHIEPQSVIGNRYGDLLVINELEPHITPNGLKQRRVIVQCSKCGNIYESRLVNVKKAESCRACAAKERRVDITGQRFGRLVVTSMVDDYISPSGFRLAMCNCHCDCGNDTVVFMSGLVTGSTQSCGCLRTERTKEALTKDISGQRFGYLTVIKRAEDHVTLGGNVHHKYLCRCDCGNHIEAQRALLVNGNIKSCGCKRDSMIAEAKKKDLSGMKFGSLMVLKQIEDHISPNGERRSQFRCRCECGREINAVGHNLITGMRTRCDACTLKWNSERQIHDLTGQRFGKLVVLSRGNDYTVPSTGKPRVRWHCRCDCGNEKDIDASSLVKGYTVSCGCMKQSKYEYWMDDILCQFGLNYRTQVKFKDLTGTGEGLLSYDFGVYDSEDQLIYLIECQGRQHYEAIDFFGGEEQFEKQKVHDRLKAEYAQDVLEIPLLEIPYTADTFEQVYECFDRFNSTL